MSEPFRTAEDAWFWYSTMQRERALGHKASGSGPGRPCDIDDIYIAATRLRVANVLTDRHISIMAIYGLQQRPPDRRVDPRGLQAWSEAMDRLHTPLAAKGIVEPKQQYDKKPLTGAKCCA